FPPIQKRLSARAVCEIAAATAKARTAIRQLTRVSIQRSPCASLQTGDGSSPSPQQYGAKRYARQDQLLRKRRRGGQRVGSVRNPIDPAPAFARDVRRTRSPIFCEGESDAIPQCVWKYPSVWPSA